MTEYTAAKDALLMYVANAAMAIPHNLEYRAAHVDCSKMIGLIMAAQSTAEPKPSGSITLTPVAPSPETIRDFERRAGRAVNAKEAEPKPDASTLPQRLRSNSYNAPTWNDCDVMREAAHALENKDAEIAAVIRDNDKKIEEIAFLKKCRSNQEKSLNEIQELAQYRLAKIERLNELHDLLVVEKECFREELDRPRNPDIEAAARPKAPGPDWLVKKTRAVLEDHASWNRLLISLCGGHAMLPHNQAELILECARAILTREPG